MLQLAFRIAASLISLYSFLCFIRIILTWVPGLSYSSFTRFLSKICDPYLNLFRGIKWLQPGSFDLSPALGLSLLTVASYLLTSFSRTGAFRVGSFLGLIVGIIWSIANSILIFLIVLMVMRIIIILVQKTTFTQNPILLSIDYSIAPMVNSISRIFNGGRTAPYKTQLLITSLVLIAGSVIGSIIFANIQIALGSLPF